MMVIMIVRFLLCVIMLLSKISLVIGSTRLDIFDSDILAHVVLLDLIKQLVSETVIIVMIRRDICMLSKSSQVH